MGSVFPIIAVIIFLLYAIFLMGKMYSASQQLYLHTPSILLLFYFFINSVQMENVLLFPPDPQSLKGTFAKNKCSAFRKCSL